MYRNRSIRDVVGEINLPPSTIWLVNNIMFLKGLARDDPVIKFFPKAIELIWLSFLWKLSKIFITHHLWNYVCVRFATFTAAIGGWSTRWRLSTSIANKRDRTNNRATVTKAINGFILSFLDSLAWMVVVATTFTSFCDFESFASSI